MSLYNFVSQVILILLFFTFAQPSLAAQLEKVEIKIPEENGFILEITTNSDLELIDIKSSLEKKQAIIDIRPLKLNADLINRLKFSSKVIKQIDYVISENSLNLKLTLSQEIAKVQVVKTKTANSKFNFKLSFTKGKMAKIDYAYHGPKPALEKKASKIAGKSSSKNPQANPGSTMRATNPNSELSSQKSKAKRHIIILDPGHGGEDPGAIGRWFHTKEKYVTFNYAQELKNLLEKTGKYKVILTRSNDTFIPLQKRVDIAKQYHGDLFISLHADSHPDSNVRGLSVYTLSTKASDKEAARLASNANKSELVYSIDFNNKNDEVADYLVSLMYRGAKNASVNFAETLVHEIRKEIKTLPDAHKYAGFKVLKNPEMPAVLIELGYLTHKQEEKLLCCSESYRSQLTRLIKVSVDRYFSKYGHYK